MKVTKQQLEKIILEELESQVEEGIGDFLKRGVQKLKQTFKPKEPAAADEPAAAGEPAPAGEPAAAEPAAAEPAAAGEPAPAEPAAGQQPSAVSPQAEKAKSLFTNMAKQYFNSLVKGVVSNVVKSLLASGQSADQARIARRLGEAVAASNPRSQAFLITNAILAEINKVVDSLSTEEFAKVFSDVAKARIQDPKELNKALKSFRMAEAVAPDATDDAALSAGLQVSDTFVAQLNAILKMKGLDATKIVKQAFASLDPTKLGLDKQKMNMAMGKAIQGLNAAMQGGAKLANPMSAPASPTEPMMQAESKRWQKLAGILKD